MRSLFATVVALLACAACSAGRAHATATPAGSAVRYYTSAIVVVADSGKKPVADSSNTISSDSARALLGDFLFRDLQRTLAGARIGQQVAVQDWALPPHAVFAIRVRGDSTVPHGMLVSNGQQMSITADIRRRGVSYADMAQMMKDIHMNPGANYVVDTALSTAARARAVLDSGIVLRIDFLKPGAHPIASYPVPPAENGIIRIQTWRKAPP